jgi:hypothetical protein
MGPLLLSVALHAPAQQPAAQPKADPGVLPVGADGKPLNLDFETGTLKDWTATGSSPGTAMASTTSSRKRCKIRSEPMPPEQSAIRLSASAGRNIQH